MLISVLENKKGKMRRYSTNYKDIGTLYIYYGAIAGIVGALIESYKLKNYNKFAGSAFIIQQIYNEYRISWMKIDLVVNTIRNIKNTKIMIKRNYTIVNKYDEKTINEIKKNLDNTKIFGSEKKKWEYNIKKGLKKHELLTEKIKENEDNIEFVLKVITSKKESIILGKKEKNELVSNNNFPLTGKTYINKCLYKYNLKKEYLKNNEVFQEGKIKKNQKEDIEKMIEINNKNSKNEIVINCNTGKIEVGEGNEMKVLEEIKEFMEQFKKD